MTDTGTWNKSIHLNIQHFCLNQVYIYIIFGKLMDSAKFA